MILPGIHSICKTVMETSHHLGPLGARNPVLLYILLSL